MGNVVRHGFELTRYEGIITNLPVVAEDVPCDNVSRDMYEYDVSLVSPSGQPIRQWKKANSVSFQDDMVFFCHNDKWFNAVGNIVIESPGARMFMSLP